MYYNKEVEFSKLLGRTILKIEGAEKNSDEIYFTVYNANPNSDPETYRMFHEQDCCESVYVEDVIGDISDLIGSPITMAEEITSDEDPEEYKNEEYYRDYFTWTFYKLATNKGYVTIRWYGTSNGCYSERVSFVKY